MGFLQENEGNLGVPKAWDSISFSDSAQVGVFRFSFSKAKVGVRPTLVPRAKSKAKEESNPLLISFPTFLKHKLLYVYVPSLLF